MKAARICKEKHIPQDIIIINILSRIPCKSLIRFRCVSKLWSSLIYELYFIDAHSDHHRKKGSSNLVLKIEPGDQSGELYMSTVNVDNGATTNILIKKDPRIGRFDTYESLSCNGLICLIIDYNDGNDHQDDENYRYYLNEDVYVFNPATRESLTLPKDTLGIGHPDFDKICLFGFHPPTKEYKVIQILYKEVDWETRTCCLGCEVFTLGSNSWRQIGDFPYPIMQVNHTACVNGSIYCLIDNELNAPNELIASFDLGNEKFSIIPSLDEWPDLQLANLVELQGTLCLSYTDATTSMDLWFLRDHASHEWIREYTIIFDDLQYRGHKFFASHPITIHNGKIFLVNTFGFVYYDPQSRSITKVYRDDKPLYPSHLCNYMESLVFVNNRII